MVDMYRYTTFDLNPAASSIDTPLHGLIPFRLHFECGQSLHVIEV